MIRKIYTFRLLSALCLTCLLSTFSVAQTVYFHEGFTNTIGNFNSASGDPSITSPTPQMADYGEWIAYYIYRTTGSACTGVEAGHLRSIKTATGSGLLPWVATPLLSNGVSTVNFYPGAGNNKDYTIQKTTSTNLDPFALLEPSIWVDVATFRSNPCGVIAGGDQTADTTIIVNDPAVTRIRFVSKENYQFDFDSVTITSQTVVPVKFTGVSAFLSGRDVTVSWNIATELNTAHYLVERSTDGRGYSNVGEVTATNKSAYSFTDKNVAGAINYYRIKGIDKDGKSTTSNVVKIATSRNAIDLVVAPTVIIGRTVRFQLTSFEKSNFGVNIINNVGQVIFKTTVASEGGAAAKTILLPASMQAGIYRLQLLTGGTSITKTIVLQ